MFKILTFNNISPLGLERFPDENYCVGPDVSEPDAILLRSAKLHDMEFPATLQAIGRAGAGVNNIPVEKLSQRGVPVFNAPGANANAVKELVLAGMLLASRNICAAWDYVRGLKGSDDEMHQQVEKGKKAYAGFELPGRTLGVIGLGAIGVQVANAALALGMKVIGFDPGITLRRAWELSASVEQAKSLNTLLAQADFITVHVPLNDKTRNMISTPQINTLKPSAVIMNFSRAGIIDDEAVCTAVQDDKLGAYVSDFPHAKLGTHPNIILLPHLGASTKEAEDNCAIMVADQLREYLENGNIRNAVNLPEVVLPRCLEGFRVGIINANVPNMVGQISTSLAEHRINIIELMNKSRGELAYTLLDIDAELSEATQQELKTIEGVHAVRCIPRV